jgi:HEAT repeat protein
LLLVAAIVTAAGCTRSAPSDPFSPPSDRGPRLEVQDSVNAVFGTAAGAIGYGLDALGVSSGPRAVDYARNLADENAPPDDRVDALNGLVRRPFGRNEPYTDGYAILARDAADPLVRAVAVRALNRSRSADHVPLFIELLSDPEMLVRLEAAKALSNLPSPPEAATPLLARATDEQEDVDVRIAAVDALKFHGRPEIVERLAALLEADEFGVAFQSRATLALIFGQDLGFEPDAWLSEADT